MGPHHPLRPFLFGILLNQSAGVEKVVGQLTSFLNDLLGERLAGDFDRGSLA